MKKNIALVMGGYSGEHDISIASGLQVYQQLNHEKYNVYRIVVEREGWYWDSDNGHQPVCRDDFSVVHDGQQVHFDLAFIIIHGNPGENGVLQGYFDMLGIRYTTCGFYTSSLTFHKGFCNPVVKSFGIVNVAPSVLIYQHQWERSHGVTEAIAEQISRLEYPLFVKPATGGSSVATSKVKSPEQLEEAIREAFTEAHEVLVEEGIQGREFDCGVFFNGHEKLVFPVTEIIPIKGHEFFDYAAKYDGYSLEVTPAEVEDPVSRQIQAVSSQLYDLLGCSGIVRFDFIYDTAHEELYFLEVNTVPGQSVESIVPKQARAMGIQPCELYEMAIQAALN